MGKATSSRLVFFQEPRRRRHHQLITINRVSAASSNVFCLIPRLWSKPSAPRPINPRPCRSMPPVGRQQSIWSFKFLPEKNAESTSPTDKDPRTSPFLHPSRCYRNVDSMQGKQAQHQKGSPFGMHSW